MSSSVSLRTALFFSATPEDFTNGEAGQARLRFFGAVFVWAAYAIAHLTGAFGPLNNALKGMAIYTAFAYIWGWLVAIDAFTPSQRRLVVIVLDEAIFCFGLWYGEAQYSVILWMPIFMTIGNGLRYGTRHAFFSASVATFFIATAFCLSPFWRSIPGVAIGIAIGVFVVPTYAVSLNQRIQRQQREAELRAAQFEEANRTDQLTGVSNRVGYERALKRLIEDGQDIGGRGALFYIDLDFFKSMNDQAGHAAGDEVLKTVARLLRESVRSNDIVARLGGDEFAIVARGLATAADARNLASTIFSSVGEIRVPGFDHLRVGATIGVCLLPDPSIPDAASATRVADELMLEGKRSGRKGTVRVAGHPDMGNEVDSNFATLSRPSRPGPLDSRFDGGVAPA